MFLTIGVTWIAVLHFIMIHGPGHIVKPPQATFQSNQECVAAIPQIKSHISLWPGEKSFYVTCEIKKD